MVIAAASHNSVVLFVRAEPGEDLHGVLFSSLAEQGLHSAAVVAVAGSAESVRYGVVAIAEDGSPAYTEVIEERGAIELTGLQGHIGTEHDGTPTAHLHGSFALADGTVVAGHVYSARALVTVEMTLLGSADAVWNRAHQEYGHGHRMPVLNPVAESAALTARL